MRKVGLILILSIFVISTFFIFYSINYPISDPKSDKDRNTSEISYLQNEQPKVSDTFEPNNNFSSAIFLNNGYYSSLYCNDNDWFKFWINNGEDFTVDIYFSHSLGNLDMELRDYNNISLSKSESMDDDETITWTAGYSGDYYINIYNLTVVGNNYDLDIYINWWGDDKYEYNNDFGSAREVFKGLKRHLRCQDDDWYMIYVKSLKTITVDIYFSNNTGNLDLQLKDNNNLFLDGSYSLDDDETITFTASYTGYYYLRIFKNNFNDDNDYDMKIIDQEKIIFYEDFEDTIEPEWSGINDEGNYMHVTSRDFSPGNPFNSLWCGNETTGFYNKKVDGKDIAYRESAIIHDLDLTDLCYVELTFDAKLSTGGSSGDYAFVSVKLLGDEYYLSPKYTNNEFVIGGSTADMGWQNTTIDLSFFSGYEHVDIAFNFEADDFNNYYEGVMIDNVRIIGIEDDEFVGYDLGIHEGDEFYYYFPHIDSYGWSEIFGKGMPPFYDEEIKIRIMSINDMGSYWEVKVLFWDSFDDFDEYTGTDEIKYKIYKNPINMKGGVDFFIPSGDLWRYFEKADNFDSDWSSYNIEYWYDWGKYNIKYSFDDFTVHMTYFSNGILNGMNIYKNYASYEPIFEMWLGNPPEEEEEEEDEEEGRSIPGYDIILICFVISAVSIVSAIKIKKSKKTK